MLFPTAFRSALTGALGALTCIVLQNCEGMDNMAQSTRGVRADSIGRTSQPLVPASRTPPTPTSFGQEMEILRFNSRIRDQPEIVSITVIPIVNQGNGPLVGVLQFAAGGSMRQRIEFDIPVAINSQNPANVWGGGTTLTVVANSFELAARNDASIAPRVGDSAIGTDTPTTAIGFLPTITAMMAVGQKSTSNLTRTIWLVNSTGTPLAPAASVFCPIPRFARSFVIYRTNSILAASNTYSYNLTGPAFSLEGQNSVGAGIPSPEIPLSGQVIGISITNTSATGISGMAVLFNLAL